MTHNMTCTRKIIHITDLHLSAEADAVVNGWQVEQTWRRIADDALARHPDAALWVLGGDLVDDESAAGYMRLNRQLAALPCPVLALAGNHDDPVAMARYLDAAHVHQNITLRGWRICALNSHIDGNDAGALDNMQLQTLRMQLAMDATPTVICIHHPPVAIGSVWLDAIGLRHRQALCTIIDDNPHVAAVLCGHAHQALTTTIGQAHCWITPSTMRQFLPGARDFALDTRALPGYRVVTLHDDGSARTALHRCS